MNKYILLLITASVLLACGSDSKSKKNAPLKNQYRDCTVLEYNLLGHDYYEIIDLWGLPSDTLYADKKLAKHKGENDSWYYIAYSWSDTTRIYVEGKTTVKLEFEAEVDSDSVYTPIKGNNGIAPRCQCYPL